MIFPNLIKENFCNTIITKGKIYGEGVSKTGGPIVLYEFSNTKCNYQSSSKTILTDKQKIVQITGTVYINDDIKEIPDIISDGEVEIFGVKRKINVGSKCRNLDGTVNYIKLELI